MAHLCLLLTQKNYRMISAIQFMFVIVHLTASYNRVVLIHDYHNPPIDDLCHQHILLNFN